MKMRASLFVSTILLSLMITPVMSWAQLGPLWEGPNWLWPQCLTPESMVKAYFADYGSIYLSEDDIFDPNDDYLILKNNTYVPGGSGAALVYSYGEVDAFSLPEAGKYHVIFDYGSWHYVDSRLITVTNRAITKAQMFVSPKTFQPTIVAGYSDGSIDLLDRQGNVLATRSGFGEIVDIQIDFDGLNPRLLVASSGDNGSLRVIDPHNLCIDMAAATDIGAFSGIGIVKSAVPGLIVVSKEDDSTVLVLDDLRETNLSGSPWHIEGAEQIIPLGDHFGGDDPYLVTRVGGNLRIYAGSTFTEHVFYEYGDIFVSAGDVDNDGHFEIAVGIPQPYPLAYSRIEVYELPDMNNPITTCDIPGELRGLEYKAANGSVYDSIVAVTDWLGGRIVMPQESGGVLILGWPDDVAIVGDVPLLRQHDYFMSGENSVGYLLVDPNGPHFNVLPR